MKDQLQNQLFALGQDGMSHTTLTSYLNRFTGLNDSGKSVYGYSSQPSLQNYVHQVLFANILQSGRVLKIFTSHTYSSHFNFTAPSNWTTRAPKGHSAKDLQPLPIKTNRRMHVAQYIL